MRKESIRIDCPQFEEALPDLDRPGTQGALLREVALAHAESCSRCARLLTESESLDFSLRSLAAHSATRTAPPRVEASLLQQFRGKKELAARRMFRWQLSVYGAAAMLALALGVSLYRGIIRWPGATPNAHPTGELSATVRTAADGVASSDRANGAEDANAFTPLPYADDPAALEGGAVVRIVLSPSALASLGFPVADLSDARRIPADLVVSEDGTPQAIRLVSQESVSE